MLKANTSIHFYAVKKSYFHRCEFNTVTNFEANYSWRDVYVAFTSRQLHIKRSCVFVFTLDKFSTRKHKINVWWKCPVFQLRRNQWPFGTWQYLCNSWFSVGLFNGSTIKKALVLAFKKGFFSSKLFSINVIAEIHQFRSTVNTTHLYSFECNSHDLFKHHNKGQQFCCCWKLGVILIGPVLSAALSCCGESANLRYHCCVQIFKFTTICTLYKPCVWTKVEFHSF